MSLMRNYSSNQTTLKADDDEEIKALRNEREKKINDNITFKVISSAAAARNSKRCNNNQTCFLLLLLKSS